MSRDGRVFSHFALRASGGAARGEPRGHAFDLAGRARDDVGDLALREVGAVVGVVGIGDGPEALLELGKLRRRVGQVGDEAERGARGRAALLRRYDRARVGRSRPW